MSRDFEQIEWSAEVEQEWRQLLALAIREDLDRLYDWTTIALVPEMATAKAAVVAREAGVVAGLPAAQIALAEFDRRLEWRALVADGTRIERDARLAEVSGPARSLLSAERTVLNVLSHLSGIASLTRRFVDAAGGTKARIYDTRKTLPGWRRLAKYAVRMGGGHNHRLGLFDAVLIKDNHLAMGRMIEGGFSYSPADAVIRAREFLAKLHAEGRQRWSGLPIIEVEVDSLDQLAAVLPTRPDIVLLDNMTPDQLREAVARRDAGFSGVELEASGGIRLGTIGQIAATGVDRISVGALTHSAAALDIGLDWQR